MKHIIKYFKIFLVITAIVLCSNAKAQVNGFTITDPSYPTSHNFGSSFPINVSFNWTPTTTNATVTINYNAAFVSYDPICAAVLPACLNITNTGSQLVINIANLASCTNTGAISFNVCFKYKCPDSCTGVIKPSVFTGTLTDNLNTTQSSSCTANGILNNSVSMFQTFVSFNQATAELVYRVYFQNVTCFKIKNPSFNIVLSPALPGATITSAYGNCYTYSVSSGNVITLNTNEIGPGPSNQCYFDYVIKLPCNTGLGQTLVSNVTLKGTNCNVPNSIISGPAPISFNIPAVPAPLPHATAYSSATSSSFSYTIINDGNTPLNLTATNFLPLVHLKNSPYAVLQNTTQAGLVCGIKYYNCTSTATATFPLVGNAVSDANAPVTNTTKFDHTINNLLPGQSVSLTLYYDLTSSCSGAAGNPPYKDSVAISFNCTAPPISCLSCGGTGGSTSTTPIYNPQPVMNCIAHQYVQGCKNIGDTINLCYEFKNVGDIALTGAVFNALMPAWLEALPSSVVYTGFSTNPTIVPLSNIKFNLPSLAVGSNTYKICFKAVLRTGAVGGGNGYWSTISGGNLINPQSVCYTEFNVCAFAAIGIDKKVKGNLNSSFASSGTGNPNTAVDYEITVYNTGTIAVDNLVVIDRIPGLGTTTILGNPNSVVLSNQFNMQMLAAPPNIYTADYTSALNPCTGWSATGTPCSISPTWGPSVLNGGVRFTFSPTTYSLAPGASFTFTFQTKIPAGTAAGLVDCNTAGFIAIATAGGYTINPVESNPVCIEVVVPEVPPGGCCKDLLKKIKTTQSVSNDMLTVNATLTAGPRKLKKVTVSLVNFEVKHPKDCDVCVKDPRLFGNITNPTSQLTFNTVPANVPFSHLVEWKDSTGYSFSNGVPLQFTIPLPPRSPIACCCDTIEYCLRYTFTDTACVMCDTTICYKIYNGKDCKGSDVGTGNDGETCNCEWKPLFIYEGRKNQVACDASIILPKGIRVSLNPNFQCIPASSNCKPIGVAVILTNNTTGLTSILNGPDYNFTFSQPGTYTYNFSGSCGGKKCNCRVTVIIR
ncbi:MAG: hypothetical protein IPL84_15955 [Chitinophagaceae bacterium]|nr:hypothetical protein [Chitinophagaceae bacterium]